MQVETGVLADGHASPGGMAYDLSPDSKKQEMGGPVSSRVPTGSSR